MNVKKTLLTLAALAALVQSAAAIPAFARKYGYSCEVCHAPVPHLKAFGEEFMDNGYRIPDKEPPRATVDTGDPLLLLQRDLPLAMRFDAYLGYAPNAAGAKTDFMAPVAMKILSGGSISETVSYYTYFLMSEDAKVVGLEDTYLNFRGIFGLPVDIIFGQYRVTDPIKATETRLTFQNYAAFKFRVGRQPDQPGLRPRYHGRHGDEFRDGLHPPGGQRQRHRGAGHLRLGQVQEPDLPRGPGPVEGQDPDRRAGL